MTIPAPPTTSIASSPKTISFAGALASTNAIKTTVATPVAPAVYSGAALNGALAGGPFTAPRTVSVTTSAHTGSYQVGAPNEIVVKGTDLGGNPVQDVLVLTATGGGETIVTTQGFVTVTEIDVPAQNDALGAFVFGVQDVVRTFRRVRIGGAGAIKYQCQLDSTVDTIPAGVAGEWMPICGIKLFGDAGTTATNVTLGL